MSWEIAFVLVALILCGTGWKVFSAYIAHKDRAIDNSQAIAEMKAAVEKVVSVQNAITTDMTNIRATQEKVEKMAEDTKNLLSKSNLAAGFQPRRSQV